MMQLPFHVDLANKVAIVTGGSGVLGAFMCRALAACGAKVVVLGRDLAKAEKLAASIGETGGKAMGVSCDVLSRESLDNALAHVTATFGPCDILINGAGGNNPKGITSLEYYDAEIIKNDATQTGFFELDLGGFDFVFDLNMMGTVLPSQVIGKQMVGREGCTIINISSMAAYRPLTKVAAYSSAKAAVTNFTQWLATHMGQAGVRVNALAPGFFITEQNYNLMVQPDGSFTQRARKVIAQTPMRRFGEPEELLGALLWLADSKASRFVTGAVIPVDGGFSAYTGV